MNKQIFNKISGKFEYQHISTAEALAKKGKADILKDDASLEVLVARDCHIANKHRKAGDKLTLAVVDAHKWADHGYVKIQGKPKVADKEDKTDLNNKLEKVTALVTKGDAFLAKNNKDSKKNALKAYNEALALDPDNGDVKTKIAELNK